MDAVNVMPNGTFSCTKCLRLEVYPRKSEIFHLEHLPLYGIDT